MNFYNWQSNTFNNEKPTQRQQRLIYENIKINCVHLVVNQVFNYTTKRNNLQYLYKISSPYTNYISLQHGIHYTETKSRFHTNGNEQHSPAPCVSANNNKRSIPDVDLGSTGDGLQCCTNAIVGGIDQRGGVCLPGWGKHLPLRVHQLHSIVRYWVVRSCDHDPNGRWKNSQCSSKS